MIAALVSFWLHPPVLDEPETLRDLLIAFPFFMAQVCASYALLVWCGSSVEARS